MLHLAELRDMDPRSRLKKYSRSEFVSVFCVPKSKPTVFGGMVSTLVFICLFVNPKSQLDKEE